MREGNLLLLGNRRRVFFYRHLLEQIDLLRSDIDVFTSDTDYKDPIARISGNFFILPDSSEDSFLPVLLEKLNFHNIKMVIAWNDDDIEVLNNNREIFDGLGIRLFLPPYYYTKLFNDKILTQNWAIENGVNVPDRLMLSSPVFPLIVKPRFGQGGHRNKIVMNDLEYLAVAQNVDLKDYVVQRMVVGVEYTIDVCMNLDGNVLFVVPRKRLKIRDGEVLIAAVCMEEDLIDYVHFICAKMKFTGIFNLQIIRTSERFELIEFNPRFGGGSDLTIAAGVNLGKLVIEYFKHGEFFSKPSELCNGLIMTRYLESIFYYEK